jgi:hypothetical protein
LCFGVFKLHYVNCNGHEFVIFWIINMTSHHCPTSNSLHMVKHDLKFSRLPSSYICATSPTPSIDILKRKTF